MDTRDLLLKRITYITQNVEELKGVTKNLHFFSRDELMQFLTYLEGGNTEILQDLIKKIKEKFIKEVENLKIQKRKIKLHRIKEKETQEQESLNNITF